MAVLWNRSDVNLLGGPEKQRTSLQRRKSKVHAISSVLPILSVCYQPPNLLQEKIILRIFKGL